jgi:hypothetical protein
MEPPRFYFSEAPAGRDRSICVNAYGLVLENLIAKPISAYFDNAGRFFPLESTDVLIPLPAFENMQRQISDPPNYTVFLIVSIMYLGIYTFLAIRKFESDDL